MYGAWRTGTAGVQMAPGNFEDPSRLRNMSERAVRAEIAKNLCFRLLNKALSIATNTENKMQTVSEKTKRLHTVSDSAAVDSTCIANDGGLSLAPMDTLRPSRVCSKDTTGPSS
ncbi:hypothetical protein AWB65_05262 [Caballeronia humi]|uniref:Uncharacterized protein n=2 Tax=Caballeronia humi TaxID=326474 RepID=A0A158IQL4_9BURK|nr:hypothetical protein AWB65_05262 [Caballeronia humi]